MRVRFLAAAAAAAATSGWVAHPARAQAELKAEEDAKERKRRADALHKQEQDKAAREAKKQADMDKAKAEMERRVKFMQKFGV